MALLTVPPAWYPDAMSQECLDAGLFSDAETRCGTVTAAAQQACTRARASSARRPLRRAAADRAGSGSKPLLAVRSAASAQLTVCAECLREVPGRCGHHGSLSAGLLGEPPRQPRRPRLSETQDPFCQDLWPGGSVRQGYVPLPRQAGARGKVLAKSTKAGRQAANFWQFQGRTVLLGGRQALCMALRLGAGRALRQAGRQAGMQQSRATDRGLNSIKHAGLKNEAPSHVAPMALLRF